MTTEDKLIKLLPLFRKCDNYADRLVFWQDQNLINYLHYDLTVNQDENQSCIYRSWDDVKHLPILTICPFTLEEARQFVEWGLKIRPTIDVRLPSVENLKKEFLTEYYDFDFEDKQEEYLNSRREATLYWRRGKLANNYASSSMLAELIGINSKLFGIFMEELCQKRSIDLASYIQLANNDFDWQEIDTYIQAINRYAFAVYMHRFKHGDDIVEKSVNSVTTDIEPRITQATLAMFYYYCHETGCLPPFPAGEMVPAYKKATEPYGLAWKPFQQFYNSFKRRETRLHQSNLTSLDSAKGLLKKYPAALELASDELKTARSRQIGNPLT